VCANNLSELELTLGEVVAAVKDAEQSMTYADRSGDAFMRMGMPYRPGHRPRQRAERPLPFKTVRCWECNYDAPPSP